MEKCKTLNEIHKETGVTRRAVQGYEQAGLVSASDRNKYGHFPVLSTFSHLPLLHPYRISSPPSSITKRANELQLQTGN